MFRAFLRHGDGWTQTDVDTRGEKGNAGTRGRRDRQRRTHAWTLSLALALALSQPVTPTMSTPVQDNISLIPPLVFHLASTHLGRGTQQQIYWSVDGPRGSETPTIGAPGRGSLRVNKYFPVEFQMGGLQ
jgi:hypothetical protein